MGSTGPFEASSAALYLESVSFVQSLPAPFIPFILLLLLLHTRVRKGSVSPPVLAVGCLLHSHREPSPLTTFIFY